MERRRSSLVQGRTRVDDVIDPKHEIDAGTKRAAYRRIIAGDADRLAYPGFEMEGGAFRYNLVAAIDEDHGLAGTDAADAVQRDCSDRRLRRVVDLPAC